MFSAALFHQSREATFRARKFYTEMEKKKKQRNEPDLLHGNMSNCHLFLRLRLH